MVFTMTDLCRVLVVDDDPMVREAYRMFLTRHEGHEVVGEARNGREAVEGYEKLKPDVVLMDLQMPEMSGVDAIREINRKHRGACIVALTTFGTQEYIVSALRAGASGYLMKDCGGPALLTGIQQALDGDMPLAAGVRRELVADLLSGHPKILTDEAEAAGLAPRERELLIWLGQGLTNAQIADKMFISEGSVKQYLSHVGDKMGLKSRTQILVRAIQMGIVDPSLMTPGSIT
jgi:two-component system response regulator